MNKTVLIEQWDDLAIEQQVYIQSIRQMAEAFLIKHGNRPTFVIKTYGCQMNEHDSEKLAAILAQMGYVESNEPRTAQLVIYNTCCVRENAELKVFGNLGSLKPIKAGRDDMIIAVCGCMMQQEHVVDEIKRAYSHVDLVFGTHNLHRFPLLLQQAACSNDMLVEIWNGAQAIVEGVPVVRKKTLKAFVNIMYGCNNFCTFCIVPYTRGRERSRLPQDIIDEVRRLVDDGVKDITLLGQNVNSYGLDFEAPIHFAELLQQLDAIPGQFRLRFMTPHPKDFSDQLIEAIATLPKVCEHVHLPVQAGSDVLLKAMNRQYTRQQYLTIVNKLKQSVMNLSVSCDIIIGFPGETDDDVTQLIDLIQNVRYDSAFTFIYSPRVGTPAATMPNQIDDTLKHRRFERMLAELNAIVIANNQQRVGQRHQVLLEGNSRDGKYLMGRTRNNHTINVATDQHQIGDFIEVEITRAESFSLYGRIIN